MGNVNRMILGGDKIVGVIHELPLLWMITSFSYFLIVPEQLRTLQSVP